MKDKKVVECPECQMMTSFSDTLCRSCSRFRAVLAKNDIAKELAEMNKGEEPSYQVIYHALKDIEHYIGELNQPNIDDTIKPY